MVINKAVKKSLRVAYGETLTKLGKQDENVVVIDSDLSCSTQTQMFAKEFPERFFNTGVAEQDAVCLAAGLSTCGKIPFVSTFAIFASGRAWDQVRNSVAHPKFNVNFVATHGGVTVGEDGASHQSVEDISLMRSIPNMIVIVPSDSIETRESIKFAYKYNGPVYVRLSRSNTPDVNDNDYKFELNKAKILMKGSDVTVVSNGETLCEAIECAQMLKKVNVNVEVISMPVVKPIDKKTLVNSVAKTGAVLTLENHSVVGGLGSAVCECLSENHPCIIKRIGVNDEFGQSGKAEELLVKYGLTAAKFYDEVLTLVEKKNSK